MCIIEEDIPKGDTPEEIETRKNIIWSFYKQWKVCNTIVQE